MSAVTLLPICFPVCSVATKAEFNLQSAALQLRGGFFIRALAKYKYNIHLQYK